MKEVIFYWFLWVSVSPRENLSHLEKIGFALKKQGHDKGTNMKGVRKGVQGRILGKRFRPFCVLHISLIKFGCEQHSMFV